jgi:transcriptional regulator with XRE-family HTH domain
MRIPKKVSGRQALDILYKCAQKCGLTPQELMEASGVGRVTRWRWMTGKTEPDRGTLLKIIEASETLRKRK